MKEKESFVDTMTLDSKIEDFIMKKIDYNEIHQKEVKKRSITPDTYRGSKFIENDFYYVDEYQYKYSKTSQVLHFGINTYREELKEELAKHNQTQKELSVKSNNTNNYKLMSQNVSLTEHEKFVTKLAIDCLFKDNAKTVLVDVFERDKAGLVSSTEAHTVVLYNIENKKILVIDPSNPQFSSHLANFAPDLIEVSYSDKIKIYQPPEKANEKGWVGPNLNQWRDCVDIAVKLAFGLNVVLKDYKDLKTIMSDDIIQCVSNNDEINTSILKDIQNKHFVKTPLRIQQKSNIVVEHSFYKFSKKLKENLTDIDTTQPLVEHYMKVINELEEQKISNKDALKEIFSVCEKSCFKKIEFLEQQKMIETEELKLLGNLYQEINDGEFYE